MTGITRRDLLKGLGAIVGATAVSYSLPLEAKPRVTRINPPDYVIDLSGKPPKKDHSLQKANQRMVEEAINATKQGNLGIVVEKLEGKVLVYQNGRLQDTFEAGVGLKPEDKIKMEDYATPEGNFYICGKHPSQKYTLSMLLSYPNIEDAERGLRANLITPRQHKQILAAIKGGKIPNQRTNLGGNICIHGKHEKGMGPWTTGCIALIDKDIKKLYDHTPKGTSITIVRYV